MKMELKVLQCEEQTINCFCNTLKNEGRGNITSIEESRERRKETIIVGKIMKVVPSSTETINITIILREVLPNCEYGQKFKAVVHKELALALIKFSPEIGDRLAFYEPVIFSNPSFVDDDNISAKNPSKYVVEIGGENNCMMWAAKKQGVRKSGQENTLNCSTSAEENLVPSIENISPANGFDKPACDSNQPGVINHSRNTAGGKDNPPSTSLNSKLSPIQRRPHNTQSNTCYKYKSLADIKSSALSGDLERVNLFAVVHQIPKELTKTSSGKFTKICKIIDESLGNRNFNLHFFVPDDVLIKQIEIGDILRLHRVKMELFNDDVDGRIFSNNDIVLLKGKAIDCPVHCTKNLQFPEAEQKKASTLMTWYKEKFLVSQENEVTLLADITEEGKYQVYCQVVSKPVVDSKKVILRVTDGSVLTGLNCCPSSSGAVSPPSHTVTEIHVFRQNDAYALLKAGTFVLLPEVKATRFDALRLLINTPTFKVLDDQNEKVAEIKRRISALEKKTENPDDRVHNAEVTKSPVKVKHNNKAVNNNSPDNETDQSYVTRSKQINGIKEKQLKFSSCVSKSCINRREIDSKKGKDSTEIENITVTTVAKRRTLFNPNCVYLSDATSEASEVVVENTLRNNKDPSDEVQPSFGDLLQLVKNKYCSPRKTSYQNSPKTSPSIEQTNVKINDKGESLKKNLQTPIVKLVKLTEEECRSATSGSQLNLEDGVERRNARSRKRTLKEEENLEDASTIVNMALQNSIPKIAEQSNKRVRRESMSTELGEDATVIATNNIDVEVIQQNGGEHVEKVCKWLFHPNNKLGVKERMDTDVEELDIATAKLILLGMNKDSPDLAKCLTSMKRRLRVFLVEVIPDPEPDDLDLVSGYCHSGCRQVFLYSKIHWQEVGSYNIPLCPDCIQIQQEKQLELIFMLELHVFDANGLHSTILVCREHAENFMRCSVREYVEDIELRRSRVCLLTDYTVKNTFKSSITPMLDVTVTIMGKVLFLIESTLKLPASP
ncbi:uncharacterized protein LOC124375210 isoform X1 [Homalodisca vitripennis]|uniref:uncharacterized protein LOC124375210 isoform X1 n=1 Tax=Homalodisca vitripennis TaxID=197043 RepID=UPI001EEB9252|nr:uncharacterized protein LOC124375210 isoform X1 [Homalodisca vitripennis]